MMTRPTRRPTRLWPACRSIAAPIGLVCGLLACTTPLGAQTNGPLNAADGSQPPATQQPDDNATLQRLDRTLEQLTRVLERIERRTDTHEDLLVEQGAQIRDLGQEVADLREQLHAQIARQGEILEAIAATDPADPSARAIPRIRANMQASEVFRQEMQQAVHESLERQGELVINNHTRTVQSIMVNREPYQIEPGMALTLRVDVGTVGLQLPGRELTTWSLGPPAYRQSVDLVPRY